MNDAEQSNEELEVLYVVTEVKPKGKRSIAVIEGSDYVAAVSGDRNMAEAFVQRFAADARVHNRQYVLAKYAKVEDLMTIRIAKKDAPK